MFDIPEEHVLDRHEDPRREVGERVATLGYNQTERDLIRDGVDRVEILSLGDGRYRISYAGYLVGSIDVTPEGVTAFVQRLLGDERVPRWLLSVETDDADEQAWFPDRHRDPDPVTCAVCDTSVAVDDVITVSDRDDPRGYRCEACWEDGYR